MKFQIFYTLFLLSSILGLAQPQEFANYEAVNSYISDNYKKSRNKYQNIVIKDDIIHIFLDENCQPLFSDYPTTARSGDKFQFHIFSHKRYNYNFTSNGTYLPTPIAPEDVTAEDKNNKGMLVYKKRPEALVNDDNLIERVSQIFGPYTTNFTISISREDELDPERPHFIPLLDKKNITLLSTSRFSVNTGIITTFLKNPKNISRFVKPNGDTTLIADNATIRTYTSLMLTFHFLPRNLDIRPRSFWERLGITFGTNLSGTTVADNYILGLNFEVTNGLFINGGVNLGDVSYLAGYDNFNFGVDKFTGVLQTYLKWNVGPYISISIDANLFKKVFNYSPNNN